MTQETYEERLEAWEKAKFAPPPEPELTPAEPTMVEMVPMRDEVRLYTEIFLPSLKGSFPVVLQRSPYPYNRPSRNDRRPISRYLEAGYAFVFQFTRGQYQSEGVFHFHLDDENDGYDGINWIAAQTWCDGNVGMEGSSYGGKVQLQAAQAKPKALKCITPTAFIGSAVASFPYSQGIFKRAIVMQWHKLADAESTEELDAFIGDMAILQHPKWGPALRQRPLINAADGILSGDKLASWRDMVANSLDSDHWRSFLSTDEDLAALNLPIFFTAGWLDATVGPTDYFQRIERLSSDREDRYLLVGPWDHYQTHASQIQDRSHGDRQMPKNAVVDLVALRLAFYDRYLKGNTDSYIQSDRVRVFITGADVWRGFPSFPAPGTDERRLYLHSDGDAQSFPSDGSLSWDEPTAEPVDHYVYNPVLPPPSPSDAERFNDRREIEIRSDVLVYTSAPLEIPLTILGDMILILHAASDAPDTDWFAQLTEVFPDGRSVAFHGTMAALRARYREGFDKEVLLTPNEPEKYRISLGSAGHQLAVGNRLRLCVYSASFPMFDPNTNTGNPVATDTAMQVARQTVFHDTARPSHLILPTLELTV